MEASMMDIIRKVKKMAKELIYGVISQAIQENGWIVGKKQSSCKCILFKYGQIKNSWERNL